MASEKKVIMRKTKSLPTMVSKKVIMRRKVEIGLDKYTVVRDRTIFCMIGRWIHVKWCIDENTKIPANSFAAICELMSEAACLHRDIIVAISECKDKIKAECYKQFLPDDFHLFC